jgi:hypothetical protein
MHPAVLGRRRPRLLSRQFERSYLEPQLIACAFEWACPLSRRPLTPRIPTSVPPPSAQSRAAARSALGG